MKKGKSFGNATAFIRKKKEKWRPSLNGSEDVNEGSNMRPEVNFILIICYIASYNTQ